MTYDLSAKLLLLSLFFSGCVTVVAKPNLLPRPELIVCPERPHIVAEVVETERGPGVLLLHEEILKLVGWINDRLGCDESNLLLLDEHLQKIESQ